MNKFDKKIDGKTKLLKIILLLLFVAVIGFVFIKFVEFDGKKVTTYKSFLTELYSKEPGDKVELVINRNGQERKVSVVLGEQ